MSAKVSTNLCSLSTDLNEESDNTNVMFGAKMQCSFSSFLNISTNLKRCHNIFGFFCVSLFFLPLNLIKCSIRVMPNDNFARFQIQIYFCCLTLFARAFSGLLTDGEGIKSPPPLCNICHTYPTLMKPGTVIPYVKTMQKIDKSRGTPLAFCWPQHFFFGNQQFLLYQEIQV